MTESPAVLCPASPAVAPGMNISPNPDRDIVFLISLLTIHSQSGPEYPGSWLKILLKLISMSVSLLSPLGTFRVQHKASVSTETSY